MAHKWAGSLHNLCRLRGPNTPKRGTKSEVAHKWADWLHNSAVWGVPNASERERWGNQCEQMGGLATCMYFFGKMVQFFGGKIEYFFAVNMSIKKLSNRAIFLYPPPLV